jgi:methylenetetrahydrofolate reductase (NADPH)
MAHLTCVNATRESIQHYLSEAQSRGIKNILALRGDPPAGEETFTKTAGGFEYSYELVQLIQEMGGFSIGAAGFPEGHIACEAGREVDWQHGKHKIDCGADFLITQVFFDNADYFAFRDYMTQTLGVTVPLIPGILPILSAGQIKRFSELCGARLPASLLESLEGLGDDEEAVKQFGIDFAAQQIADLLEAGVPGIHLYTLNKAHSTTAILKNLVLV